MKIGGVEIDGPGEEYLVLPRPRGNDIVFIAHAVSSTDEFDQKCPEPKPKPVLKAGGWQENLDDPSYLQALSVHGILRYSWMVLKSLEPSMIEWDTVDPDKPSTWSNWQNDLRQAGLSQTEINRVTNCVSSANSLDEAKLEQARESFLSGLAKASEKSSGPVLDQEPTPSGEPVSGQVSDLQE